MAQRPEFVELPSGEQWQRVTGGADVPGRQELDDSLEDYAFARENAITAFRQHQRFERGRGFDEPENAWNARMAYAGAFDEVDQALSRVAAALPEFPNSGFRPSREVRGLEGLVADARQKLEAMRDDVPRDNEIPESERLEPLTFASAPTPRESPERGELSVGPDTSAQAPRPRRRPGVVGSVKSFGATLRRGIRSLRNFAKVFRPAGREPPAWNVASTRVDVAERRSSLGESDRPLSTDSGEIRFRSPSIIRSPLIRGAEKSDLRANRESMPPAHARPPSVKTLGGDSVVSLGDELDKWLRSRDEAVQRSTSQQQEQERSRSPSESPASSGPEPQHRGRQARDTPLPERSGRSRGHSRS